MELKRILARDARSANEKAIAQYGADVLVISSSQVNGLTELIVAVDIPAMAPEEAEPFVKSDLARPMPASSGEKFDVLLGQTLKTQNRAARSAPAATQAKPSAATQAKPSAQVPAPAQAAMPAQTPAPAAPAVQEAQAQHDTLRGREIVALVREELAQLRREFKLSQQMAAWNTGAHLHSALWPLRDALNASPMPVALRALLLDGIQVHTELDTALQSMHEQLSGALQASTTALPQEGVHVLAGPSGAGKSLMVARLAQAAALAHGDTHVKVISYHDQRAGAWHQTQLLNAQSGVECYRATTPGALKLLLEEHAGRGLILIDTPGVQMAERLAELRAMGVAHQCHAVLPAESSAATLQRVLKTADVTWHSVLLTKLDEASQPWAWLQCLCETPLAIAATSHGDKLGEWTHHVTPADWVRQALAHLPLAAHSGALQDPREGLVNQVAAAHLAHLAQQLPPVTGLRHE